MQGSLTVHHGDLEAAEEGRGGVISMAFEFSHDDKQLLAVEGIAGKVVGGDRPACAGDGAGAEAAGEGDIAVITRGNASTRVAAHLLENAAGGDERHVRHRVTLVAFAPHRNGDRRPEVQRQAQTVEAGAEIGARGRNTDGYGVRHGFRVRGRALRVTPEDVGPYG